MKTKTCVFLFICFIHQLSSQEAPDQNTVFNIHKYEVGIDFSQLFSDFGLVGSALILKKRIGEKKFVSPNLKKALRFRLGTSADLPTNRFDPYNIDGLLFSDLRDFSETRLNLFGSIGLEWQRQRNRVQYFYGVDLGLQYHKYERLHTASGTFENDIVNIYAYSLYTRRSASAYVVPYGGVKFFLSPEFSLSLESGFSTAIRRYITKVDEVDLTSNTEEQLFLEPKSELYLGLIFLRSLNLSYYF